MFDLAGRQGLSAPAPRVLHHYTTWAGAEGILASRQFWATAHECTNDEAELATADAIVIEVAKELRASASGTPLKVLDSFIDRYSQVQITESVTACLVCFSVARDDEQQWKKYADDGFGICLTLRTLDEPAPNLPSTALCKVDYSESSWRNGIRGAFEQFCAQLSRVESCRRNLDLGLSALHRIAAFWCITAKRAEWADEQEYRHVTLVPRSSNLLQSRVAGGRTIEYLPVFLRRDRKRIALAELLIGPNRDAEKTRQDLQRLLADNGYEDGSIEYPTIAASARPSWRSLA